MATFKLIFGLGVIVLTIYLGIQIVPAYYSNYEFQDTISREALDSTYRPVTEDDIRAEVLKDAKQYDVPITETDVKVARVGKEGAGSVSIEVNYVVHVSLPVYPFDLHFNPSSSNKGIY
jgi:hypothetical protein